MSKSDKHIKKSIKESFDSLERKAPEGLWSNVSQASNLSEDEFKIRESFNHQTKSAPSESWNNVKQQLIIDEVWNNIVEHEDRRRRFIWWYFGSASIILILFSLSMFNLQTDKNIAEIKNDNRGSKNSTFIEKENSGNLDVSESTRNKPTSNNYETSSISSTDEVSNHNETTTEFQNDVIDSELDNLVVDSESISNIDKNTINDDITVSVVIPDSNYFTLTKCERIPAKEIQLIDIAILDPVLARNFDTVSEQKNNRFEIGVTASYGNSWLFNNDVKNGLNKNSLISNRLSSGYSFGGVVNYNLKNKSGLEIVYDFYSIHNQGYDYYNEGRLFHKDISLKQQKVSLAYKLRFTENSFKKRNFLVKTGFFYSHSIREQILLNANENTANSSYNNLDYGLKLGAGVEYNFAKFKIEYGLKSDIGLHNITASSINIPKKFNYATTYILGGYISIRYLF